MSNLAKFCILALLIAVSYAQFPPLLPLYKDINYQGTVFDVPSLTYSCSELYSYGFNDVASSLVVPVAGYNHTWINLFKDVNFGGTYRTFGANSVTGSLGISDLRAYSFNDETSSLTVHTLPLNQVPTLVLYADENYGGASYTIMPSTYMNLGVFGWANRVSSFVLTGRATFFNNYNLGGSSISYASPFGGQLGVPTMPTGWNDIINSVIFGTI